MKFGITVEEIMQKNFPIVDCRERVTNCVSRMGEKNACLIIRNGDFNGILSKKEILEDFSNGLERVNQGKIREDIGIISSASDVAELIELLQKNNLEFVIVKKNSNIIGIVCREDLKKINLYPQLKKGSSKINRITLI